MHVSEQASKILNTLEKLPPGEGLSAYHAADPPIGDDAPGAPEWVVAYRGMRFAGETLTDALGQLTAYLEMRP